MEEQMILSGTEPEYEQERKKGMPSYNHAVIQSNLNFALRQTHGKTHSVVSELTLKLGEKPYTPDLSVYPKRAADWLNDIVKMTEPPLVAIEIDSPTQAVQSLVDKAQELLRGGVQSVWLVLPSLQTVTVFVSGKPSKTFVEGIITDGITGIEVLHESIFSTE